MTKQYLIINFKKAFRKVKCLYEYKVKVLVKFYCSKCYCSKCYCSKCYCSKCYCSKCTEFRSKNKWFDPEHIFKEENYVTGFKMRGNLLKFEYLYVTLKF